MDLEAEFYKETEKQPYNRLLGRYTPYYVEWLESKLEANQKDIEVWHENLIKKKNYKVSMDLEAEFYKETEIQAYCRLLGRYNNHYVEWLKDKLDANQKDMDLEAEFHKETKMKAYSNLTGRYTNYYVEWLEERLEREIMKNEN